jgi:hypothetical protein
MIQIDALEYAYEFIIEQEKRKYRYTKEKNRKKIVFYM